MLHGLPSALRDEDTAPFWEGCDRGELLAQRCRPCRTFRWPPGPGCPTCGSAESEWVAMSGTGTVYSWVVVRVPLTEALAAQIPYAVGLIELSEGIRIVSTISGCGVDDIHAGMAVRAVFPDADAAPSVFTFMPA
jgi:uncharacterized OB-fold protein